MVERTSHRVRWTLAAVAAASIAGAIMLDMKAEPQSPAMPRTPSPAPRSAPDAAPAEDVAPLPSATPRAPAPAHTGDAALPTEGALLREIEDSVRAGRIGHARSLADRFYRAFPESPETARIERLTGYHPRPYGPRP